MTDLLFEARRDTQDVHKVEVCTCNCLFLTPLNEKFSSQARRCVQC